MINLDAQRQALDCAAIAQLRSLMRPGFLKAAVPLPTAGDAVRGQLRFTRLARRFAPTHKEPIR
jgi:hypothetical protein